MLGGLPQGSTLEEVDERKYMFRWTIQEVTSEPLMFIANDSGGASTILAPVVHICACVNSGNCTLNWPLSGNLTVIMNCHCNEGTYLTRPVYNRYNFDLYNHDSIQWTVL